MHPYPRGLDRGQELDYAEATSPVTVSATSAATATTYITGHEFQVDGATPILIEAYWAAWDASAGSGGGVANLWEDGVDIGRIGFVQSTNYVAVAMSGIRRRTPAAGKHTYLIKVWKGSGTVNIYGGSGGVDAYPPAVLRITVA